MIVKVLFTRYCIVEPSISISLSLSAPSYDFEFLFSAPLLAIPEKRRRRRKGNKKRGGKVNEENRLLSGGKPPLGGLSIIYKGEPLERESSSRKTRRNEATSFLRGCNATFGISLTFRIILVRSESSYRIPSKSWRGRRLNCARGEISFRSRTSEDRLYAQVVTG